VSPSSEHNPIKCPSPNVKESEQEAQLSQRNRALLRVVEYFAKPLEVIRNDTLE